MTDDMTVETAVETAVGDDTADEEMFADLGRFEPGAIPVDAVMSRGRAIRTRRRLTGAGALALAACLVVLAPVAARWGGGSGAGAASVGAGPAQAEPTQRVTVSPPQRDSRGRVNFAGSVDGKRWTYTLGGRCDGPQNRCMDLVGLVLPPVSLLLEPTKDGNIGVSAEFADDVTQAVLTLSDGEQITLSGITVITGQTVAITSDYFELPRGETVVDIAVYGIFTEGVMAHADPRPLRSDIPTVVQWYKPDGSVLHRQAPEFRLAQGGSGPGAWTLDLKAGSWDNWFVYTDANGSHTESVAAGLRIGDFPGTTPGTSVSAVYGLVSGLARRVDVVFSDGTVTQLTPVISGVRAFVGTVAPPGKTVVGTAQYDAAGHRISPP